jgi:CheY-like chemotaxis protein/two-component sensor histidine kinase
LKRLEAQVQINERMASVGTLAASLAHEMNTPLQYLKAGLDALGGKTPNEGALRMALEGAERIREVVRDVKAFSHVDPDARRTRVDVVDVLHRAVRLARLEVEQRATLEVEVGQLPPVEANDAQLAHVFLNLLINAGQAIAPGSRGHVRVSGRTTPAGAALIEVHDDGSGIAPDAAPFVFEPFFTTKPAGQGTGLGLAVCHGVVLALGGTLTFESAPGRTVFRVELPASTSLTPPAGVPSVRTGPARRSVLVVDDHPAMCTSLQLMLHEVHEVEAVTSALEALTLMEARLFDVVLCDLMMPGLSGMELYEQVRAKNPEQASRFVFMTGGAATRSAARFLEQTHARVLEKPFAPEQLYAALR